MNPCHDKAKLLEVMQTHWPGDKPYTLRSRGFPARSQSLTWERRWFMSALKFVNRMQPARIYLEFDIRTLFSQDSTLRCVVRVNLVDLPAGAGGLVVQRPLN